MTHIIHKMRWEVAFAQASAATSADADVSELANNIGFQRKLDHAFSTLCPAGEWVSIDKIEVDLGQLSAKNWQVELEEKLLKELQEKVVAHKSGKIKTRKEVGEQWVNLCLSVLQTGNLPKSLPKEISHFTAFKKWVFSQTKAHKLSIQQLLLAELKSNPEYLTALSRWPLQAFWPFVFEENKPLKETLKQAEKWEKQLQFSLVAVQLFRADVWRDLLKNVSFEITVQKHAAQWFTSAINSANAKEKTKLTQWFKAQNIAFENNSTPQIKPQKKVEKPSKQEILSIENENKPLDEQPYFLRNAGFVLMAPFFPSLFKTLAILQKNEITNPATALALLHFMDSGTANILPIDNVLYKVLLGLSTDKVALPANRITIKQKEEIDAVLSSAIAHWKVLKNTSAAGLRSGFFMRDGILERTETEWKLRVETQTQDVLLSHLPWSIGIIKLPWMPKPLHVDWG